MFTFSTSTSFSSAIISRVRRGRIAFRFRIRTAGRTAYSVIPPSLTCSSIGTSPTTELSVTWFKYIPPFSLPQVVFFYKPASDCCYISIIFFCSFGKIRWVCESHTEESLGKHKNGRVKSKYSLGTREVKFPLGKGK